MLEYKVLNFSGDVTYQQRVLSRMAEEGWRLVSVAGPSTGGHLARGSLYAYFEREKLMSGDRVLGGAGEGHL
jgi:hypothetical protein